MPSEEQNNITHWKTRLDALEHIDGDVVLDKDTAWNKVHLRLNGPSNNKKVIWYWSAAACLGLMIVFFTMKMDRKTLPAKQSMPEMPSVAVEASSVSDHRETDSKVIVSGKKKPSGLKLDRYRPIKKIEQKLIIRPDTFAVVHAEASVPSHAEIKMDSSANLQTTAIIHKKLPVVHINELEEVETTDERIAAEPKTKDSKIRIKKDRTSTKRAMALSGSSSGHLKIVISLNN